MPAGARAEVKQLRVLITHPDSESANMVCGGTSGNKWPSKTCQNSFSSSLTVSCDITPCITLLLTLTDGQSGPRFLETWHSCPKTPLQFLFCLDHVCELLTPAQATWLNGHPKGSCKGN